MQAYAYARETGDLSPDAFGRSVTSTLLKSFAPAPQHRFHGELSSSSTVNLENRPHQIKAHGAGVTALALEKFEGRLLISGGAEGGIKIWDLEEAGNPHATYTYKPVGAIARASTTAGRGKGHSHGVTHLGFFPFDAEAFMSSSFDKTLKLWSTARATLSAEFHLNATVYSHATSPIADHLLVSCATQHSNVRLVDLRSGAAVQALVAHGGPVLCTSWSPRHEHILATGHADGKVRIWDVRRAGGVLGLLDQEDSLGIVHRYRMALANGQDWSRAPRFRASAQAHDEAVNGVHWSDDGRYIITSGLDKRIRVWDADTGANTLASFGSAIQNGHAKTASILTPPSGPSASDDLLIWANDQEILFLNMHQGAVITRLRIPGMANPLGSRGSSEMGRNRVTTIAWRSAGGDNRVTGSVIGGGNSVGALYSAHMDGQIRAWMPTMPGPDDIGEDDELNEDEEGKKRKRKAIDDAYKSLMGKSITFT